MKHKLIKLISIVLAVSIAWSQDYYFSGEASKLGTSNWQLGTALRPLAARERTAAERIDIGPEGSEKWVYDLSRLTFKRRLQLIKYIENTFRIRTLGVENPIFDILLNKYEVSFGQLTLLLINELSDTNWDEGNIRSKLKIILDHYFKEFEIFERGPGVSEKDVYDISTLPGDCRLGLLKIIEKQFGIGPFDAASPFFEALFNNYGLISFGELKLLIMEEAEPATDMQYVNSELRRILDQYTARVQALSNSLVAASIIGTGIVPRLIKLSQRYRAPLGKLLRAYINRVNQIPQPRQRGARGFGRALDRIITDSYGRFSPGAQDDLQPYLVFHLLVVKALEQIEHNLSRHVAYAELLGDVSQRARSLLENGI